MRDAAGEEPERFKAVGLHPLVGREFHFRGVAERDGDTMGLAIGVKGGAGRPHDRGDGAARHGRGQGILADQRQGLIRGERPVERGVGRAPALLVDEAEDLVNRLALHGFGRAVQEPRGRRIDEDDEAMSVRHDHSLGDGGQGLVRKHRRDAAAGGQRLAGGDGANEARYAGELALASKAALRAQQHRHATARLVDQLHRHENRGLRPEHLHQPRLNAVGGALPGQRTGEGLGVRGAFLFGPTEGFLPRGRVPESFGGEIEFERAQRAEIAERLHPRVIGDAGFLELLALRDVELQADDPLQLATGAGHLKTEALDPHPVALLVLHAEFEAERPRCRTQVLAQLIRGGGGIVGVQQLAPLVNRVGQLGVGVPEDFFPGRGIVRAAGLEVEVEESRHALFGQEAQAGDIAHGRDAQGLHRLDRGDVAGGGTEMRFEPHDHVARKAGGGFGDEQGILVERRAEQHLPLRHDPAGFVRNEVKLDEMGEMAADRFPVAGSPKRPGRMVGRRHAAVSIQQQDRTEFGRGGGRGRRGERERRTGKDGLIHGYVPASQRCVRLARKSM